MEAGSGKGAEVEDVGGLGRQEPEVDCPGPEGGRQGRRDGGVESG